MPAVWTNGCQCRSATQGKKFVDIGNVDLISKRAARVVSIYPKGTLSDYIPFYFTPYSPMLYNIKTGHNGVPQKPMKDIVILVSSLHRLKKDGISFVFSDRHAYLKTALFSDDLKDLDRIIWSTLQERNFRKDDVDRFDKYQAEALVHKHLPLDSLEGVVCYNDVVRADMQKTADVAGFAVKIISRPGWYL